MKFVVIGGGPVGMMAAITSASAENGNEVNLIEKMQIGIRKEIWCNEFRV